MNIVKSMLFKQVWDNIAQENYFRNVGLKCTDILSLENRLMTCLLTGALSSNILGSFYLMLAQQLIYGLCENNEQVPVLTGTLPINN